MGKKIFITGVSSGIGKALCKYFVRNGDTVYALGRREPGVEADNLHFISANLKDAKQTKNALCNLFGEEKEIDIAVLNAGIIGELESIATSSMQSIEEVMDVNVWANKRLLDFFIEKKFNLGQVVALSSGAAVNASVGWGGYTLSKSTLNTLIKLYANEFANTHFSSIAPGVVSTPMVKNIIAEGDPIRFPSVERLKNGPKRTPSEAAELLSQAFEMAKSYKSGAFLDVRTMKEFAYM